MSNQAERFLKLKEKINQRKSELEKAQGALEVNMKRLKDEFGVQTVEEADIKLEELEVEIKDLQKQVEDQFAMMEKEYGL